MSYPEVKRSACVSPAPLATGPEVLLMDEPTSSLDPSATRTIEDQALALAAAGMPILWVTHDAAHVVCLIDGAVTYRGSPAGLFTAPDPRIGAFLVEQPS